MKKVAIAITVSAICFFATFVVTNNLHSGVVVHTYAATRGDISSQIVCDGTIVAKSTKYVAVPAGVRISKLYVSEGEIVEQGQPLASVDKSELEAQLALAQQSRSVYAGGVDVGQNADQSAYSSAASAKATAADERAAQLSARIAAVPNELTSPIDGMVVSVFSHDVAQAQGEVAPIKIISTNYQLKIDVDEFNVPKISEGQDVSITLPSQKNQTYRGVVSHIMPFAKNQNMAGGSAAVVEVFVDIPNPGGSIRFGYSAQATIKTNLISNGITIPYEALVEKSGEKYVYIVRKNIARLTKIETGAEFESKIEVKAGVPEGAQLVLNPSFSANVVECKAVQESPKESGVR